MSRPVETDSSGNVVPILQATSLNRRRTRRRILAFASIFAVAFALPGCSVAPDNGTVPMRGIVQVDGQAAAGVSITLHPIDEAGVVATATSGPGGVFELSTYAQSDGVKPGRYKATFIWGDYDAMSRSIQGDRLKGKYDQPAKSKIEFSIRESDANGLGIVDISTK